ncbi:MAG TPA: hypothetical protein VD995_05120 [Azospirillum sp.]|nr:hypothetical protein [Azospirillum sp.]
MRDAVRMSSTNRWYAWDRDTLVRIINGGTPTVSTPSDERLTTRQREAVTAFVEELLSAPIIARLHHDVAGFPDQQRVVERAILSGLLRVLEVGLIVRWRPLGASIQVGVFAHGEWTTPETHQPMKHGSGEGSSCP